MISVMPITSSACRLNYWPNSTYFLTSCYGGAPDEDIAYVLCHISCHSRHKVEPCEHLPSQLRLQIWPHHEKHLHTIAQSVVMTSLFVISALPVHVFRKLPVECCCHIYISTHSGGHTYGNSGPLSC